VKHTYSFIHAAGALLLLVAPGLHPAEPGPALTALGAKDGKPEPQPAPIAPLVPLPANVTAAFASDIQPLLRDHCYKYHGEEKQKGDVNLAEYRSAKAIADDPEMWNKVIDVIRSGDMPPSKELKMADDAREKLADTVEETLTAALLARGPEPGPPIIRRLTHAEDRRSVRDLLAVDFDVAGAVGMPEDPIRKGYDNLADALKIPPALTEKYLAAADAMSKDGIEWEENTPIEGKSMLRRIVFGKTNWVGVGDRGRISSSPDGKTWTDAPDSKALDTLVDVAFGNGIFVGVSLHGLRRSSADGSKWSEPMRGLEGEHLNSIVFTGKEFVAIGAGATYRSPNGKDWKRVPNKNAPTFATFGGRVFVGTSWRGRLLSSRDGVDWKDIHKCEHPIEAITFGA